MTTSDAINELSSALAKAQMTFVALRKDKTVKVATEKGTYTYQYADLADVLTMALPRIAKEGLSVVQLVNTHENAVTITTRLMHSSGQWLEDTLILPIAQTGRMNVVQAIGSIITYGRRYHLSAMLGIVSEADTDTADIAPGKTATAPPPAPPEAPPEPPKKPSKKLSAAKQALLDLIKGEVGDDVERQKAMFNSLTGKEKMSDISDEEAKAATEKLRAAIAPPDE